MNVYRVELEQWTQYADGKGGKDWVKHESETVEVRAATLQSAINRSLTHARKNGYLKSRPIEVTSASMIARDVL